MQNNHDLRSISPSIILNTDKIQHDQKILTPMSTDGVWTPETNEILKPVINVNTSKKKPLIKVNDHQNKKGVDEYEQTQIYPL